MRKDEKHLVWSNIDLDLDDWRADLRELYPGITDEDKLWGLMNEINNEYLDDERENLNIQLPESILVIADLGLWNGRFSGYREIKSGNIKDCLYSGMDYSEWYVDYLGDFRMKGCHHDGTNYYLYRQWKEGLTSWQKDTLLVKIYEGEATRADITRYTKRIGDRIAEVYGWDIPICKRTA